MCSFAFPGFVLCVHLGIRVVGDETTDASSFVTDEVSCDDKIFFFPSLVVEAEEAHRPFRKTRRAIYISASAKSVKQGKRNCFSQASPQTRRKKRVIKKKKRQREKRESIKENVAEKRTTKTDDDDFEREDRRRRERLVGGGRREREREKEVRVSVFFLSSSAFFLSVFPFYPKERDFSFNADAPRAIDRKRNVNHRTIICVCIYMYMSTYARVLTNTDCPPAKSAIAMRLLLACREEKNKKNKKNKRDRAGDAEF